MQTSKTDSAPSSKVLLVITAVMIVCALSIRIFTAMSSGRLNAVPILASEVIYDAPAQALARGDNTVQIVLNHYPGFTFFLTALFRLTGVNYAVVRLILFSAAALTCVVIYFLTRLLTTPAAGVVAGLCYALFPPLVIQSLYILPGCLFALLIVLSIGYAVLFQRRYEWKYGIALGFLLAYGAYFEPWIILYPAVYGVMYMALYVKNSFLNCFKLLVIPLLTMLALVTPWCILLFQYDSMPLLMRSGGLLLDRSAWMDFIPAMNLKIPFLISSGLLGVLTLTGLLLSYRNKLFMPFHAFMLVSLIVSLVPGVNIVYRPALYAVASIYAGAGCVVCGAKICKFMHLSVPWLSDQSWRYR